jgi:hypothetical protein
MDQFRLFNQRFHQPRSSQGRRIRPKTTNERIVNTSADAMVFPDFFNGSSSKTVQIMGNVLNNCSGQSMHTSNATKRMLQRLGMKRINTAQPLSRKSGDNQRKHQK